MDRGCLQDVKLVHGTPPELGLTSCPVNLFGPNEAATLGMYQHYRNGILFVLGGIGDQPAKYVDAMTLLERISKKRESDMLKASSKKHGKGKKSWR